jgi:hypothetical protein
MSKSSSAALTVLALSESARTGRKKDEMQELQILCANGERRTLELEAGSPLIGVWKALKNLGTRNRRQA